MNEPSDTTPNTGRDTTRAECENCGASLTPLEATTIEDDPTGQQADPQVNEVSDSSSYEKSLYFCDEECLSEWESNR